MSKCKVSPRLYTSKICQYINFFFFQAEDGIRDLTVTGVQTCALPICSIVATLYTVNQDADQWHVAYGWRDRKSTRLNSSHSQISYAVFCLKKKKEKHQKA